MKTPLLSTVALCAILAAAPAEADGLYIGAFGGVSFLDEATGSADGPAPGTREARRDLFAPRKAQGHQRERVGDPEEEQRGEIEGESAAYSARAISPQHAAAARANRCRRPPGLRQGMDQTAVKTGN